MEKSLLGDDGANQEGDQHDDRDRLPADPIELIDQRCQPQRPRPAQYADQGHEQCAEHLKEDRDILARVDRGLAEIVQPVQNRIGHGCRKRIVPVDLTHLVHQAPEIVGYSDHLGRSTG
ncbi:hypothetical protein J2R73_006812 [Bradyrhizobium japonicum]|nr:hypothetical protein [Bradyrhizobium japonicum]MCP1861808.1 hypothetical protein [Bradyrhizobium japonicum]MCP1965329.1 hypothetical protein [Bradyrhizobium japonicum]